ncbi:transformation/transcription domain-associated protein [Schistocerca serialis cubense]|uniref:transformation/transcription domain-associated protein n=1 Tax=Schistocerca serialis cubense TaxID=2023355 RepID=UPI00214F1A8A|nr:transformation/transcription domain-associated protein [Schistocerca serialis cubense]
MDDKPYARQPGVAVATDDGQAQQLQGRAPAATVPGLPEHYAQMTTYRSCAAILADPGTKDEIKLKAAQEISENFETILMHPAYQSFLDYTLKIFIKILQEGETHFIAEYSIQQVRKLILEVIHRLPTNEVLRPYVKSIISLMMRLLEIENEENVLVCLRIIIELHKQYRPVFNAEIQNFLHFVKSIYRELPNHMPKIFEPRAAIRVSDISEINVEALLKETFTMTVIQCDKKSDDMTVTYNLIPRAVMSLKVLQELPIIVVLMYQLYKQQVHQDVADFIPLIMTTISLQPTQQQRMSPSFNKEVFVDFMGAQIKTLSFLAYIIRIYQEVVAQHASQMVKGMLSLLTLCPMEVANLRKELMIAARHILATDLRTKFVPIMERLFDENVLLGKGFTTHETLRPLAYSTLADLVHHVRQHLPFADLERAVHLFSRNVQDDSLPTSIQTMSCKLLLNLVDCIRHRSEIESGRGRELLLRMLETFIIKFKNISKHQLPTLLNKCKAPLPLATTLGQVPGAPNPNVAALLKVQPGGNAVAGTSLPVGAAAGGSITPNAPAAATVAPAVTPAGTAATSPATTNVAATAASAGTVVAGVPTAAATNAPFIPLMSSIPTTPGSATPGAALPRGFAKETATQQYSAAAVSTSAANTFSELTKALANADGKLPTEKEEKKFGFPQTQGSNYTVTDCRALVKTLVCGAKTITWGCAACKVPTIEGSTQGKLFHPKETLMFIRLVKWGMKALDIYTLSANPMLPGLILPAVQRNAANQTVRSKEEKEVLEHFSGVFSMMNPLTFNEVFSTTIEFVVDRIYKNSALQVVANSFLANPTTSPVFATVLLEYLLKRMEEMGNGMEKSNLYLKLFKLVFGSVSLFPEENKHMLRPHLHKIVNRSMELAMTAKEPFNYFLLLRALFRSIGGGSHDLLYQEFLPLLPNLLQGLNSLQSGLHKQHMKDLFVELCLTVPVRLSSLLPYLPMLMDPLVSALNGSHTLISQGLRTLDLCVDNLQPDFLYEHIQPVRAELMQALWRTLRNPSEQVAHVAFRVLGKFGGGNRKMMVEPQKLTYSTTDSLGPEMAVCFQDHSRQINLPVEKIIETAFTALKSSSTDPFYRRQSWEVVNCYLIASISLENDRKDMKRLFSHPSFTEQSVKINPIQGVPYKCPDARSRATHQTALTAMLVAAAIKELRSHVLQTLLFVISHYTMVAISQQAGPFSMSARQSALVGMDPLVLIDALAVIMGHEEKELLKPGNLALILILETATNILGTKQRACRLPLMEYLSERMCALCYDRAWYAKVGGCVAIKFFYERMDMRWIFEHLFVFLKALLFVMMDLTGEVSNGAVDLAKNNLEKMLTLAAAPIERDGNNEDLLNAQSKSLFDVTHELVRQVTRPNTLIREQTMHSLEVLAKIQNKTVTEVMEPHKEVLEDMIPPKKHLLRHQPANAQIGLMDGNTFCTTMEPRLFTIDLNVTEHKVFFHELISLCEADDAVLAKLPCYKNIHPLTALRKSALQALAACHYIPSMREKIFTVLYKAMEKPCPELQEAAFECTKKFLAGFAVDAESVQNVVKPVLDALGDYRILNLNATKRLSYLIQLFPACVDTKFCDQMLQHIKKLLDLIITAQKGVTKTTEHEQKITTIINIFHQVPSVISKYIEPLCRLTLHTEKTLNIEASSPFREPLMKFLLRYPQETIDMFLKECYLKDPQWNRFLEHIVKSEEGKPLRDVFQSPPGVAKLSALILSQNVNPSDKADVQYIGIMLLAAIIKFDRQWLSTQQMLINSLKKVWMDDNYLELHKKVEGVDARHWREPKLIVKILLHYFCHHPNDVDLLFQLLRAFCYHVIPDFQFLRNFLETTVAENYTVEWKRTAFFRFVDVFHSPKMSQDLKAKVLQMILIPCFAESFERGEGEKIIGTPPLPDQENPENVVSVFVSKIIDPDNPFGNSDSVRIFLLQFACLLVDQAAPHIHDAQNKRQGLKVRRLLMFAWPCLMGKNCVDQATRYHGHLLLSHIIAKFAIHKRIKLQVFHSLLKAHAIEARAIVRQALEILTPLMPVRMEDGYTMLTHWTKKIIVEEGHSMQQLFHILQLVVRHYKVYYPVRHHLVQHMVNAMQRLGFSPNSSIEHRRLAVELADVIIKWDLQRIKDEAESTSMTEQSVTLGTPVKRTPVDDPGMNLENPRKRHATMPGPCMMPALVTKVEPDSTTPIDTVHADAVLNFLLRLACQVNDTSSALGSPGELLSRRCVALLKTALKPEVWPRANDLKIGWLDKIFLSVESATPNYGNICTALDLLAYLVTLMKKERILANIKPLQRGLAACVTSSNTKVIRLTHSLMTRLMSYFPTESTTATVASKYEELECLYSSLGKFVCEGLSQYEKQASASPTMLYGPLMMLKSACINNQTYIDRLITPFMRVLQKLTREHLSPSIQEQNAASTGSDLLILSLDMVKNRVVVMGADMRKTFIGTILVGLIEKSPDIKVMKAITKMLEDWMKNKNPIAINQTPTLREKSILLVKMMHYVEKRFPDELELNAQFLDIVNFVYRDENLKQSELGTKLEPAFLAGLRCVQPPIRAKFFEVFDASMKRKLHDRLLYIMISQNWEPMGPHYWIKQCIELLVMTANPGETVRLSDESLRLPPITYVLSQADSTDKANYFMYLQGIRDDMDEMDSDKESEIDLDGIVSGVEAKDGEEARNNRKMSLRQMLIRQSKFMESVRNTYTSHFLVAMAQLCHMDTGLAESVWLDFFPRVWRVLSDRQQSALITDLVPFLASGAHVIQKDCHPSALNSFTEGLTRCIDNLPLKPSLMKYIGKSHNLWHRISLILEKMIAEGNLSLLQKNKRDIGDCYEFEPSAPVHQWQEVLDALSDMYSMLSEEDMWAGLWQKHARYRETNIAIMYEQQGFFEHAQGAYEVAMSKVRSDFSGATTPGVVQTEMKLWEDHWIRCSKELNQWDILLEYANDKSACNPLLLLETSWRVPNWNTTKEALTRLEQSCPKDVAWKLHLFRGYITVCHPDENHLNVVDRYVEIASTLCMREWRRLPSIVSHVHLPLLQAAQQIIELQEAAQIHQSLLHACATSVHDTIHDSLRDMKATVKTWRNRLPVIADDLSHWSDIFTWRQHHYSFISAHCDSQHEQTSNHGMLGVHASAQVRGIIHASAQAILHFGKIARKQNLTSVALGLIYTVPSLLIVDCFQKLRQQIKCYVQLSTVAGRPELKEALDLIESTNLKYFTREMTAELYSLKGMLLSQLGRSDEANKAFSAAVQLHDTLLKAWANWGDYLEQVFTQEPTNLQIGHATITCFLHACRHQNEHKSRKYIAKVLWLLTFDDERLGLAEAMDKYSIGIPPLMWLPWVPQLLGCILRIEGKLVLNLISQIGRMFPQAVYFPIRTLYLTLKIEQRERNKNVEMVPVTKQASTSDTGNTAVGSPTPGVAADGQQVASEAGPIRATPPMWRCSRVMHMLRDIHPTVLSSLEGIVDQMVWFRENWYEEVLRQLRLGLAKCLAIAFENSANVEEATITPHTLNFIKKLVSTFGIGIDLKAERQSNSASSSSFVSTASESLASRARATAQDPVFQMMKVQFTTDFDFSQPDSMKLQNLIQKLRKWITILEAKVKTLPKSFLIEEKCRFLSNFSIHTAEVELPGEFLLPKHTHYYVRISRFMPRVDVVQKHNTAARRLYIRGHNGKIYPYLVVNDSSLGDSRREERVLQLLRFLNHYLSKQKETARRFLHFTVPRVVAVAPQMRLVEDNPSSISLLDIFRESCAKNKIDFLDPVSNYYDQLSTVQARGSQPSVQVLREILQDTQKSMVPRTLLSDWALRTFTTPTDYWQFRKMFTLQLSLACFCEYVLHLTRLNPDMMYIHQNSGLMNIAYFKFDVDDMTGELDSNRPVPFRLTPNIVELLTMIGINGPFTASIIATARCLAQPAFKLPTYLRAILRDEMAASYRKKQDDTKQEILPNSVPEEVKGDTLIVMVNRAVAAIMSRVNCLANFDGIESKASSLVNTAMDYNNLCRTDPAWHPWL